MVYVLIFNFNGHHSNLGAADANKIGMASTNPANFPCCIVGGNVDKKYI